MKRWQMRLLMRMSSCMRLKGLRRNGESQESMRSQ